MIQSLIDFFSFVDPNVRWVVLGIMMMCASSAVIGVFAYLRKRALVGDAVSHSILPGVCLAFMFTQQKSALILLPGAFVTGWLSLFLIDLITTRSKIKTDTAIALILSVFYGIGILLLTSIQNSGSGAQSGLDKFLFGKAAALVYEDVIIFTLFSFLLLVIVILFYRSFKLISFDVDFAHTIGLPVRFLEVLLSGLTVMSVAIGIQAVGVVLMAALLITPAAAARYWTNNLKLMLLLAALFGAFSGIAGAYVSYTVPRMPTGPWVVMVLSLIAIASVLLGRKKGIIAHQLQLFKNRRKMLEENILKCLYQLGEKDGRFERARSKKEIQKKRSFTKSQLKSGVFALLKKELLYKKKNKYGLTSQGIQEGKRVTRIHRLWELYLTKHLHLASDHVHEGAEAIEHIITPELEKELEIHLDYPTRDPHQSPIPYK